MHLISVQPFGGGWVVRSNQIAGEQFFSSGEEAESAARGVGDQLAEIGEAAEIRFYKGGGELAGRFVYQAPQRPSGHTAPDHE